MDGGQGRLVYGGSFNPVHIGHMRLALECLSHLGRYAESLDFMPSAVPPHKKSGAMLPFGLRSALLNAAIAGIPGLFCNEIEADLPKPSFTYETLRILAQRHGAENLFFLLGSQDFILLPEWHRGLEIPHFCSLVIAPRGDYSISDLERQVKLFWPESGEPARCRADSCLGEDLWQLDLPWGSQILFLPVPYLDISATRIRKLWLCGQSLDYLVPQPALEILAREQQQVYSCWQE